jgi:NAD-dependent SIR2 family protein deacetylase
MLANPITGLAPTAPQGILKPDIVFFGENLGDHFRNLINEACHAPGTRPLLSWSTCIVTPAIASLLPAPSRR